ncbi:MAG: alpha-glucan family phosphorylase, partial [Prosthecobacter sp.]|nr:alpha-glucan family phosphorylase [Prosthecobacter sp.]
LLLTDPQRLQSLAARFGGIQLVFAGKAHPRDQEGKNAIRQIIQAAPSLGADIRMIYLENYDWDMARLVVAGVDVWLNTPLPPLEASGTSGMKAALNGVPSLSVLDGWWLEGCIEGVTGWAVGENCDSSLNPPDRTRCDAASLYDKLESSILPSFYHQRDRFIGMMRHAIALNASYFNTHRMIREYALKAYLE